MKLLDTIRSAGGGKIVGALADQAGIRPEEAEEALQALLPEIGRAIRRTEESPSGAAAVVAAMDDERYPRYLDEPAALRGPAAASDGERLLADVLDHDQRDEVIRRVAGATGQGEGQVRKLLPLAATLAMAALGRQMRESAPEVSWFGTRPGDRFSAPLLNALTALFEQEEGPAKR